MTNVSNEDFVDQITYDSDRVSRFRRRLIKVEQRLDAMELEDRDALINKCYEDGFKDGAKERLGNGITDTTVFRRPNHEDFIPVDDDGVWKVSATTMNLLYAMFLWSGKNGIDNEDDWEDHLELMREHLNNLQGAKK